MFEEDVVILLVEDEEDHAELIRRAFLPFSDQVRVVTSGSLRDARNALTQILPDLVIADLNLPDGLGLELLTQDREAAPFPVLVLTSFGDQKAAVEAIKSGAVDYVTKSTEMLMDLPHLALRAMREWDHIKKRRQTADELKKSEERLDLALNAAELGLWDWNILTGNVILNQKWAEMLGYTLEEIEPDHGVWDRLIHPEDNERVSRTLADHLQGLTPAYLEEYRVRTKSGTWKWILDQGKVVERDEAGHPLRATGIQKDITERKNAEEALRQSEKRLSELIDFLPDPMFAVNRNGHVILWNRALEDLTGVPAESMLSKGNYEHAIPFYGERRPVLVDLILHYDERVERLYPSVQRLRDALVTEVFLPSFRGGIHLWSKASPLYDSSGEIVGAIETLRDVTERRRLESQMQQMQKLESLGVLAGGIAHDFNNLLVGILGNASLALKDVSAPSCIRTSLEQIEKSAERAAELTNQLLAYSGRGKFIVQPIDLNQILADMAQLLEVSVSKKAKVMVDLAPSLPQVDGDVNQIRQILINLVTNASESLEERSGVVTVSTGVLSCTREHLAKTYLGEDLPEGDYVYVQVVDTGSGMDAETIERIFDPFFTTKFAGRGLGLAAVLGIVRGHDGTLQVESQLGHGSTFRVLFPSGSVESSTAVAYKPTEEEYTGRGTILVVDDEEVVRLLAEQTLCRVGFEVLLAEDGCFGVEMFREHQDKIVAVLLDVTMPRMGGEETFKAIRAIRNDALILLSSGYTQQEATERFEGIGLAGFIQKPYKPDELVVGLIQIIESGQLV